MELKVVFDTTLTQLRAEVATFKDRTFAATRLDPNSRPERSQCLLLGPVQSGATYTMCFQLEFLDGPFASTLGGHPALPSLAFFKTHFYAISRPGRSSYQVKKAKSGRVWMTSWGRTLPTKIVHPGCKHALRKGGIVRLVCIYAIYISQFVISEHQYISGQQSR